MATKLYKYYQLVGSKDWHLAHAEVDLRDKSPEFITVLNLDTILDEAPTREVLDAVRYVGPVYFDLDAADLEDSLADTLKLVAKLEGYGLQESDMEIYLSGKKGFHITIDQRVVVDKVAPRAKLPAIYKEMAFNLAVESLDMRVYTARKGRMFRTCYNVRENGLYKVPVTLAELRSLTPETYTELAKSPRFVPPANPQYRPEFALLFEAACQKIDKFKPKKSKPVDAATLQSVTPEIKQILSGVGIEDVGFNKVAMQLCLFARESNWSEQTLIEQASGLVNNWVSDGRYSTPRRREAELRRMFFYLQDNPAYEFSAGSIKSLLVKPESTGFTGDGEDGGIEAPTTIGGVVELGERFYAAVREDSTVAISNFSFRNIHLYRDVTDASIRGFSAVVKPGLPRVIFTPAQLATSSGLHSVAAKYGLTFTGSDTQARGIYDIVMKQISLELFEIESEGVNLVSFDNCGLPHLAGQKFLVWVDGFKVLQCESLAQHGLQLNFKAADGSVKGTMATDLSQAPDARDWVAVEGNKERLLSMARNMFAANNPETVAKCLGWMAAATYKPLIQQTCGKFPLLHVYGPAGLGKTEFTDLLLSMFYYREERKSITPNSTPYALLTLLAGSSSIPLILDEWKPATMNKDRAEEFRGLLRDVYNAKTRTRGGISPKTTVTTGLHSVRLSSPLVYISEAPESETAIVERSVMTAFRRASDAEMTSTLRAFNALKADTEPLTVIGKFLVAQLLVEDAPEELMAEFDRMYNWALTRYTLQPGDEQAYAEGRMSEEDFAIKQATKPRPLFNSVVVMFGLIKFRKALERLLGEQKLPEDLDQQFKHLLKAAFFGLQRDAAMSVPEYIKVLRVMADMTVMLNSNGIHLLEEGMDYALSEHNGDAALVLVPRMAFGKYLLYLRSTGQNPLFSNAEVFAAALKETPAFLKIGGSLPKSLGETVWLSEPRLSRFSVPRFKGRAVKLNEN